MNENLTIVDVYLEVNKHVAQIGQAEIARRIGVTRSYVNLMVNAVKPLSDAFLNECGISVVKTYNKRELT